MVVKFGIKIVADQKPNESILLTGHDKIVELLCNHDAVTNITDSVGETPFHYAAIKGK